MGRMTASGSDTFTMEIPGFLGLNTATQFSQIDIKQSPRMLNLLPNKVGGLSNRDGTRPLTLTPTPGLKRVFRFRKVGVNNIVATAGVNLYKYDGSSWTLQTMTTTINNPNGDAVQFRDNSGNEILVIAPQGALLQYNGTAVTLITPKTPDDTAPLPPNGMTAVNALGPVGITTHNNRLVVWYPNSDTINHSKPGFHDYFPTTSFQRFVNNNDYVQTCISFGAALIVFMRNSIGALFGDGYSSTPQAGDWSQDFLDTTDGCVNPRSVQIVVFPGGDEMVFYQTDRGVSSVMNIDTKSLDNSTRIATRSMTDQAIDWNALGVSDAEWAGAKSYFHQGIYYLVYKQGSAYKGLCFDATSGNWFPIDNVDANDFYGDTESLKFINEIGHLKRFQDFPAIGLDNKDYTDINLTAGTPVRWEWYSKLLNPQMTGFNHFWDILMIEAQQFANTSVINVEVNTFRDRVTILQAVKTEIMIVGVSEIGQAQIANNNLTDIINDAKRLRIFAIGQYAQIRLFNDAGQPTEFYDIKFETRPQLTY